MPAPAAEPVSPGELIAAMRRQRGLSLSALAQRSGVVRATIERWEKGKSVPSLSALRPVLETLRADDDQMKAVLTAIKRPRAERTLAMADRLQVAPNEAYQLSPHVGELIRTLRLRRSYTLAQVARKVGVSPKTIQHWEAGRNWPSMAQTEALCEYVEASSAERETLNTRQFPTPPIDAPWGRDVADTFARLRNTINEREEPIGDLDYYSIRATIAAVATRESAGLRWIASSKGVHAEAIAREGRNTEAAELAWRAYRIAATAAPGCAESIASLAVWAECLNTTSRLDAPFKVMREATRANVPSLSPYAERLYRAVERARCLALD